MPRKTIKDIAREAGYSTGTVSRVLNGSGPVSEAARKRILEVVEKHNFQLNTNAKFLKQSSPQGIAIVIKGTNNLLFTSLVELLQKRTEEAGWQVSLFYLPEDADEVEEAIRICEHNCPEGILFLGSQRDNFRHKFDRVPVPSVLVTNSAKGLGFENLGSVTTDDAEAAQCAVMMLLGLNHRKIGVLGGRRGRSQAARSRYQGLQYAYVDYGLDFDSKKQYVECLFSMEDGYRGMQKMLEKMPDVTAVFAMSDVMAIGAVRAIVDAGKRVPEDISVIGFDGIELSQYLTPRLATIRQDQETIAEATVEMLKSMIEDNAEGRYREVPYEVYMGESLAPARE